MKYVIVSVLGLVMTTLLLLGMAKLIEMNGIEKQTVIECFPIPSHVFESGRAKESCTCWFVSQHAKTRTHFDGVACNALFMSQSDLQKLPVCQLSSANLAPFLN
ncbi:hypothetical protein L1286_21170 [Pseudoalteromonas sp. SMS1]|uniref:hypothetical protein n=1 Tax=Pseudoalteromonas sp. SMS1 TaxID=2908894 RepID=UPI001F1C8535|nr:hypothetical protein [Pseudoalteromonas sp. SMS1]MCF2859997.1 hypothetical protein [Pseudoalteromonas sp. SMS1]